MFLTYHISWKRAKRAKNRNIGFHGNGEEFSKSMAIFIGGMSQLVFTRILNKFNDYAFPIYFGPYRELVIKKKNIAYIERPNV